MARDSKIEWTQDTWQPITGCSVVSPGCTNCYAMRLAGTRLRHHPSRAGLTRATKAGPVWTGEVRLNEQWLAQPLRWSRPRMIFVCAHGDLFHESVPDAWIDRVFAIMARARQHTFQVLTKRAERMREYLSRLKRSPAEDDFVTRDGLRHTDTRRGEPIFHPHRWPLPNVWLGVSAEDQPRADERIPHLLATPAAVRWVSAEPLLGPLDLRPWLPGDSGCEGCDDGDGYGARCSRTNIPRDEQCPARFEVVNTTFGPLDPNGTPEWFANTKMALDWIVVGGESGPGARPMHPDWARSLRDQCAAASVPFFFKQWGAWVPVGHVDRGLATDPDEFAWERFVKSQAGRSLDRREHNAMPANAREEGLSEVRS